MLARKLSPRGLQLNFHGQGARHSCRLGTDGKNFNMRHLPPRRRDGVEMRIFRSSHKDQVWQIAEIQAHHVVKSCPASTAHLPTIRVNARLNVQDSPPGARYRKFQIRREPEAVVRRETFRRAKHSKTEVARSRLVFLRNAPDRGHSRIVYDLVLPPVEIHSPLPHSSLPEKLKFCFE